jgi:ferredoxin-NADP reductase
MLEAAAPRGDFVLDDGEGPVALVSAGIGVTPVVAMLHRLAAEHSARPVWWVHSARGPAEHALAAETRELLASLPHPHEHLFYSTAGGRLTADKLAAIGIPADATAYICGPAGFMNDMRDALTAAGLDNTNVHTELFGTLGAINPGITGREIVAPHPPPGEPGSGPQITFARSGLSVPFDIGQANLLDFADSCDVPTRWSCRTGVCHMCATPLLSGEVTYAPDPLEPPAPGQVLLCCSQPSTDLVLDL